MTVTVLTADEVPAAKARAREAWLAAVARSDLPSIMQMQLTDPRVLDAWWSPTRKAA